jgi:hypothetical protein
MIQRAAQAAREVFPHYRESDRLEDAMNHDPIDTAVQSVISNMSIVLLKTLAKLKRKEENMKGKCALAECGDAVYHYLTPINDEIAAALLFPDERLTTFFNRWESAERVSHLSR